MRRFALAIALAFLLSGAVRAGEIHTTVVAPPPPPPSTMMTTGETFTADETAPEDSSGLLTFILTLIDIVR